MFVPHSLPLPISNLYTLCVSAVQNLQVELQATKDSYRTLEAERDFLESSLAETESLSRAQSARRVSSEAREADLSRAMKELMSQCEEQQLEVC